MYSTCMTRSCIYYTDRGLCGLVYTRDRTRRCPHYTPVLIVPDRPGAEFLRLPDTKQTSIITYRLEYVSCGKCKRCKEEGPAHGPYWYAYWKDGRRTRSRYIGKAVPEAHTDGDNSQPVSS